MADLFKFQERRRSFPPLVLQGKNPQTTDIQQTEAKGSKDLGPDQEENQEKTEETGNPEQESDIPNPGKGSPEAVVIPEKPSKEIDSPIASITPL
jgi:hypothetical protein